MAFSAATKTTASVLNAVFATEPGDTDVVPQKSANLAENARHYEPSWANFLSLSVHLPLWSASGSLILETFKQSGANSEVGFALYSIFQNAGLPAPVMTMEVPLGNDPQFVVWMYDLLCSLLPEIKRLNLPVQNLGAFATLPDRLQREVAASNGVVSWPALVGAWTRKPPR